jgi:thiosulfate/3-mercaptopyruvate sulfurtransferase
MVPPHPGVFQGQPQSGFFLNTQELLQLRSEPNFLLIDARSPERYRGEQEPIDAVAGHIPGARNYFHGKNIAADGTLLPVDQLRQNFQSLFENTPPEQSIFYCGSGVTSCFNILAMRHAGLKGGRIYAGSWSEWIRDPNRPIQTGGQP